MKKYLVLIVSIVFLSSCSNPLERSDTIEYSYSGFSIGFSYPKDWKIETEVRNDTPRLDIHLSGADCDLLEIQTDKKSMKNVPFKEYIQTQINTPDLSPK